MTATARNISKRLSDKAKPWIIKALKDHDEGEIITWELGLAVFPDPSSTVSAVEDSDDPSPEVGLIPALVIYLELPTDDPTVSIYASPVMAPFGLTSERVNDAIKKTLIDLRAHRELQRRQAIEDEGMVKLDKL